MARYAINAEGEASLRQLARDMLTLEDDMEESWDKLEHVVYSNEDELGSYFLELVNLIDEIKTIQGQGASAMKELAVKVDAMAEKISLYLAKGIKKKE